MAAKYKVGDKVVIKKVIQKNDLLLHFAPNMNGYLGAEGEIVGVFPRGETYMYRIHNWWWLESWIDGLAVPIKAGPLRDKNGRFMRKEGAPVRKEKPVQAPAPVAEKPPVDRIEEFRKRNHAKVVGDYVASYALLFDDNTERLHLSDLCHARMKRNVYGNLPPLVKAACLFIHKHGKETREYENFIKWMLNNSPWSSVFLTKSVAEAFDKGILVDVNKPLSHVTCGAVAIRTYTEFLERRDLINRMVKDGYSYHEAMLAALVCHIEERGIFSIRNGGGHMVGNSMMNADQMIKFFKEGFHLKMKEESFRTNTGHYELFKSIAHEGKQGERIRDKFTEKMGFKKIDDGWGGGHPEGNYAALGFAVRSILQDDKV